MKQCFIFDFDGVICDSEKYHYLAWKETAKKLSLDFSRKEYVPFQSRGRFAVIRYLCEKANVPFTDELFQSLSAVKSEAFARLTRAVGETDLIKGADVFIKNLYEKGYSLAIASSASTAKEMLHSLRLDPFFAAIVDGKDNLPKKPDPAVFTEAANRLNALPENCIVFEDSPAGVAAAKNGGFRVIGIGENLSGTDVQVYPDFTHPFFNCFLV